MGTFAKFNQSSKNSATTNVGFCTEALSTTGSATTNYVSSAKSESSTWHQYVKLNSETCHDYNDDGTIKNTWTEYWTNFDSARHTSSDSAMSTGKSVCTNDYINPYNTLAGDLQSAWDTLKTEVETRIKNVDTCLNLMETAATTFDGLSSNVSAALAQLEAAGLADNIKVVEENGVEVMYYQVYDENGNIIGKFSISEMVNSFYTFAGSAMAGAISTALMYGDGNIPAGYLNNLVAGIGNNVYNKMGQGFMSVVTLDGIAAMYDAAVGKEGAFAQVATDFESILKNKIDDTHTASDLYNAFLNGGTAATLTGSAAFAAGNAATAGTKTYSEENVEEQKKRMEQQENKPPEEEKEDPSDPTEDPSDPTKDPSDPKWSDDPVTDPGTSPGPGPGTDPGNGDDPGSGTDPEPGSGTTPETDNRFTDLIETELPSEPLEVEVTNEDIDTMARDEFYDRYSVPEDLAERRQLDIEAFEELFNSENRDALIQKFEEMGYDAAEALGAANNKDVGLAAYLLGSQNQELTQIAQEFADELGLGDMFDTSYDDAPDYNDLFDGDAQVELTSPTASEAIVEAKVEVQEAKDAYAEAIENANNYIEDATKAKGDLETIRASIESVSGTDTSKWTDEQIEQYNKATENYNTAVTKANEEVAAAEEAKAAYAEAKENLQKVEDEYYDEIREAIKKQNGVFDPETESAPSGTTTGNGTTDSMNGTNPGGTNTETNNQQSEQSYIDQLFVNM